MRSWNSTHTSLTSTINAKIDGTINLNQAKRKAANSAQGILMGVQALTQAASGAAGFFSGNWGAGLTPMGQMFGTGTQVVGAYDGAKSGFDGSINLGLNGNIDTEGLIEGSAVVKGIAQPTISLKYFDTKNTQVGQGVWNIKHAPVVYTCRNNRKFIWTYGNGESCTPCFFDPNSIELELNPNVFPEDQIEWLQVDALCMARKNMQPSNDDLRSVYGLSSNIYSNWDDRGLTDDDWLSKEPLKTPLYDFLYASMDKYGFSEVKQIWSTWNYRIYGRCDNTKSFSIEPNYSIRSYYWATNAAGDYQFHSGYFPFYEVNVKVTIKMKNIQTPIVLSRNYLPEYKAYGNGSDFTNSLTKTKPYASKMKGHTDLYDYQMKRISDIMTLLSMPKFDMVTSDDVGKVIGKDGNIYKNTSDATAGGTTAVAMIAYVGSDTGDDNYKHGLAIALSDEGAMNWEKAKSACENKATVPGGKWYLPSRGQWDRMISSAGNFRTLRDKFSSVGGTNMKSSDYWSSTEYDSIRAYYYYFLYGGCFLDYKSTDWYNARACLAF